MDKSKDHANIVMIVAFIGVVILGLGAAVAFGPNLYFVYFAHQARSRRVRLLCEVDHQALLDACRQLSRQVMSGKLEATSYRVRRKPDPEVAGFPEIIRALRPRFVAIHKDGQVKIEMAGAFDSFGVYAYPPDYKPPPGDFKYHDRELLDGLWYYDDLYESKTKEEYDNYDKRVEALLRKAGKLGNRQ